MHHALARVGAAVAAVALLAGCASASDEPAADDTSTGATQTVDADFYFQEGDLPAEPQRVLALWRTGSLLADLGVVPVGALEGELLDTELTPEQYEPVADVPTVGTFEGIDIEAVIELDPDLIVGMDHGGLGLDDTYAELGELYPTAILQIAEPTDVWANYTTVAQLVGQEADYDERAAELDASLADIADTYGDQLADLEVTSIGATGGSIWVDTSKALSYERIIAAGYGYNPDYTENPERYAAELALENIPSLADQDAVFYDVELDGTVSAEVQALLDEPAFQELPAVQAGHLFPLTGATVYTFVGQQTMVNDLRTAAEELTA